jgi:hypothetical protein
LSFSPHPPPLSRPPPLRPTPHPHPFSPGAAILLEGYVAPPADDDDDEVEIIGEIDPRKKATVVAIK